MKILVVPDSFKGSLKASEVASIIKETLLKTNPINKIDAFPLSDGGDGFIDALMNLRDTSLRTIHVHGANHQLKKASYLIKDNQAFIEMAQASGLDSVDLKNENAMDTSTIGVGEIVLDAYKLGVRNFFIGLGGSATNDGGMGFLYALGYRFLDKDRNSLPPKGRHLYAIHSIDDSNAKPLKNTTFTLISDVDNPLTGHKGAANIFGPQKGLNKEEILYLDQGLNHYASLLNTLKGKNFKTFKGSGAAGGLSISLKAFFNASMKPGASFIIDLLDIESSIQNADIIISGEGKFDQQTASNKAPYEIIKRAKKYHKFIIILAGTVEQTFPEMNIDILKSIHPKNTSLNNMLNPKTTKENLIQTLYDLSPYFKKRPK